MRKLAVVLLSASVCCAQLSNFVAIARPHVVVKGRLIADSTNEKRKEHRLLIPDSSQLRTKPPPQLAFQELARVIDDAQTLQSKTDAIKILAKSANLLWLRSPTESRSMFQQLWKLTNEQIQGSDDREDARTDILRYLTPRDSKLGARFLEEASSDTTNRQQATVSQQVIGRDPTTQRLMHLASKLVQQEDHTQAARVLERALAISVTPAALPTLTKLRQGSPMLADGVVSKTLEQLKARPTVLSLPSLYLLVDYVFPASNVDSNAATVNEPSQRLRTQYFSTAYATLKKSLSETPASLSKGQSYSQSDLRFRSIYQNQLAGVLAALAPRFAPELAVELTSLGREQVGALPPDAEALSRLTRSRLSADGSSSGDRLTDISLALAKGDIQKAEQLLGGVDETIGKQVAQTISKVAFGLYLAKSEFNEALREARKLEDADIRAISYSQLARASNKKPDPEFSRMVVTEAVSLFASDKSTGLHARALLMLAPEVLVSSVPDSLELLRRAVTVINDLPEVSKSIDSASFDEYNLDDPLSLRDAPELQRAFSKLASQDFEGTLSVARQLEPQLIGMYARLASLETALKKDSNKTRQAVSSRNHRGDSFEFSPAFLSKPTKDAAVNSDLKRFLKSNHVAKCSCSPCIVKTSFSANGPGSTAAAPNAWWNCTYACMREAGVSPIALALCATTCVGGAVPVCAVCLALHITAFTFCSLYCSTHDAGGPAVCTGRFSAPLEKGPSGEALPMLPVSRCCDDLERYNCDSGGGTWDDPNCTCISPIVIDVAGNGFNLTNAENGVRFDISATRVPRQVSWTSAYSDDAWLALDRNGNGRIEDGAELFGSSSPQPYLSQGESKNGFRALAMLDNPDYGGNNDGQIDGRDSLFANLLLWQDRNHNGVSEVEELQSLSNSEIRVIELAYRESKRQDEHGNWFRYRAKVRDARGAQVGRWAWDVFLRTAKISN